MCISAVHVSSRYVGVFANGNMKAKLLLYDLFQPPLPQPPQPAVVAAAPGNAPGDAPVNGRRIGRYRRLESSSGVVGGAAASGLFADADGALLAVRALRAGRAWSSEDEARHRATAGGASGEVGWSQAERVRAPRSRSSGCDGVFAIRWHAARSASLALIHRLAPPP